MNPFLSQVFSWVCSQDPAHTWAPGGESLPFCQRCTGLYAGAAIAFALLACFRPRIDARYRWIHLALVMAMIPFGYHLVPHGALVRTLSGQWFAFGIVGLLWPMAARRLLPDDISTSGLRNYAASGLASMLLLPAVACWGGKASGELLRWMALIGLAVLTVMLVLDFVLLAVNSVRRANCGRQPDASG